MALDSENKPIDLLKNPSCQTAYDLTILSKTISFVENTVGPFLNGNISNKSTDSVYHNTTKNATFGYLIPTPAPYVHA
jgi:hypothetical protein